jgi:DNA-binding SARP family transcriptional activator
MATGALADQLMMEELQLELLGGLSIGLGGAPVTDFVSRKAPALLCYLVLSDNPQPRKTLATLMWSGVPQTNANKSLSTALSNLRRLFSPYLTITRQTASFNHNTPHRLDVREFQQRAEVALAQGPGSPEAETYELMAQAASQYQGDFLEGFYVRDAPAFEEWVLVQRERLRQLALRLLHALSTHCIQHSHYLAGIEHANRLLTIEPWQEDSHRKLMQLLALSGQRSAAMAQYQVCRRILVEELGAEPEAATTTLYESILRGEPIKIDTITQPGQPHARSLSSRDMGSELEDVTERLLDPTYRLVTLVGDQGTGKTRLALAAAERVADSFADGTRFVPPWPDGQSIDPAQRQSRLAAAVLSALAAPARAAEGAASQMLLDQAIDQLRHKEMLLVLDGLEAVLPEGADLVLEILQQAPRITILVTSRERLNLKAEYSFRIPGQLRG